MNGQHTQQVPLQSMPPAVSGQVPPQQMAMPGSTRAMDGMGNVAGMIGVSNTNGMSGAGPNNSSNDGNLRPAATPGRLSVKGAGGHVVHEPSADEYRPISNASALSYEAPDPGV